MNALIFLIGFFGMEVASWVIHKYIMHGILWSIHKTHHQHNEGFFELNDIFSAFFGSVSIALMIWGVNEFSAPFWVGLGIAIYGAVYFVLHDVWIHRRAKVFGRVSNTYLNGIKKAHQAHHRTNERDGSESFGLLFVSSKFFKGTKPEHRAKNR